jgi:uncharacterized protein (DUF4213/DUF364 family)
VLPWSIYDLLLDYASLPDPVEEVAIGPIWTLCRTERGIGLAMSPQVPSRVLEWPGTLCGRSVAELAGWVRDFEPYAATVGMAAVNAALADLDPPPEWQPIDPGSALPANLSVFEHFLPQIDGRRVVVVGRYPGLDALARHCRLTVLERNPGPADLSDPAAEYVLPEAEWVFLTASSLTNKTFPRLAELSAGARTVLMGPTLPWLPEFADYGIDYLAGVEVLDAAALRRTVAEGGGVRIFEGPVRYRLAGLGEEHRLAWLRERIADVYAKKEVLTLGMDDWYRTRSGRFPELARLEGLQRRLSALDSAYKALWDRQQEAGR